VNNPPISAVEFSASIDGDIPVCSRLAVAVSGGADSMALLLLLKQWTLTNRCSLHALSVDHKLRPESAQECTQVARWCEALGIAHTTLTWEHAPIRSAVQQQARDARYALMFDWCRANRVEHLFTAHHLDDQIETFMLRLLRGSGLVGLSAMRPSTERDGISLHRPLLAFPKARLVAILEAARQPWLEDPSNQNTAFTRNALRTYMSMLTPQQKVRFHAVIQCFLRFRNGLEKHVEAALAQCFSGSQLDHDKFMRQPVELKTRILHHICNDVSGNGELVRSEKIRRLLSNIEMGKGKHTLHGVMYSYLPKESTWSVTRTKPLAANSDLAQNTRLQQRKK
jgi:tRNA(Ile)-lysidine synthase